MSTTAYGTINLGEKGSENSMPESDSDEFAAYDFAEFTEADFEQIDEAVAKAQLPKVPIAYEHAQKAPALNTNEKQRKDDITPLNLYRRYVPLSVSDLSSPAWCELQFEYGLRGKRSRPLLQRPASFKSTSGKEIKVNRELAVKNDVVTSKGQAIHKSLEREIKSEPVPVRIRSKAERWALRLVNMLICLKGLQHNGFMREIPVFGIEEGEVIVGIIDEVVLRAAEKDIPNRSSDIQTDLHSQCSDQPEFSKLPGAPNRLHIIDTKTRKTFSLPREVDRIPAQLQLMLYYRLLSKLVSHENPFDFMGFWQTVGVDPTEPLSMEFLLQSDLVSNNDEFQVVDLLDLSVLWQDLIHQQRFVIDDILTIIYRAQSSRKRETRWKNNTPKEEDMSKAIEASVCPARPSESIQEEAQVVTLLMELEDHLSEDRYSNGDLTLSTPGSDSSTEELGEHFDVHQQSRQNIIGRTAYKYDHGFLSAYLADTMQWWRGERSPKGVPVELAGRCNTCEYREDCEWREAKAKDFMERAQRKEDRVQNG